MAKSREESGTAPGSMAATMLHRRQRYILDRLRADQEVRVKTLAGALDVSEATVRRDLEALERQGLLQRVHGGGAPVNVSMVLPLNLRKVMNEKGKERIAAVAASLLEGTNTVFLGGGSAMLALANRLADDRPRLYVTNMIDMAVVLAEPKRSEVVLVGGHLNAERRILEGPAALAQLRDYCFDAVVTSTNGIDASWGFLDHDEFAVSYRRALAELTRRHIVLAERSKFGRSARYRTFPLAAATDVVTDVEPGPDFQEALRSGGVMLHVASTEAPE